MSIATTIYATLAPLTTGNRVFPDVLPQGTFTDTQRAPAIRYTLIAAEPDNTVVGSNEAADQARYQIDHYASTRTALMTLVDASRSAIAAVTSPPPTRELEVSGYEDDTKLFVYTIDWVFHPSA